MTDAPIANSDEQHFQVFSLKYFLLQKYFITKIFFGARTCHSIQTKYPISERIGKFYSIFKIERKKQTLPLYPHSLK